MGERSLPNDGQLVGAGHPLPLVLGARAPLVPPQVGAAGVPQAVPALLRGGGGGEVAAAAAVGEGALDAGGVGGAAAAAAAAAVKVLRVFAVLCVA